jgi:cation diffusion facilitator family transporter
MTADGFHSLSDGSSNIVGLVGIKLASKPLDKEHPYGHSKFETLSGLFISVMLFAVAGKVILSTIKRFESPINPTITIESLIVLIITLLVNILVSLTEYRRGKALNSQILISDSMHTRSDIYVSVGVLFTLLGVKLGMPPIIDLIASLIVAGFIIHAAYEIFKENSNVLVDTAIVNSDEIKELVMNFKLVKDTYNIRSRGCSNNLFIDMHIMVQPDLSIEESHILVHNIEDAIRKQLNENTQVFAHLEPYNRDSLEERDDGIKSNNFLY